jgi:hypothetical protein
MLESESKIELKIELNIEPNAFVNARKKRDYETKKTRGFWKRKREISHGGFNSTAAILQI